MGSKVRFTFWWREHQQENHNIVVFVITFHRHREVTVVRFVVINAVEEEAFSAGGMN